MERENRDFFFLSKNNLAPKKFNIGQHNFSFLFFFDEKKNICLNTFFFSFFFYTKTHHCKHLGKVIQCPLKFKPVK